MIAFRAQRECWGAKEFDLHAVRVFAASIARWQWR
jgi:hypothetical protein